MNSILSRIVIVALTVILFQRSAAAQSDENPFTLSVDVDLVLFNVTVLDRKDHPISGLKAEQFRVFEDGVEQQIRSFRPEDIPATVGLVIDNSGSMTPKRSAVISAALEFVSSSNPQDEIFVVNFNDDVSLPRFGDGMAFTNDYNALRSVLMETKSVGRTALYDGIAAALGRLESGKHSRKALVILSDGGDNASAAHLEDIVQLARRSAATLFTIGFYDPSDEDRNPKVLRQLSRLTGGESYLPRNAGELQDVWRKIAGGIRSQYTIGYVSSNAKRDGLFRNVKIAVVDKNGRALSVRTRTGYIGPKRASEVRP